MTLVFIGKFGQISHLVLIYLLLNMNISFNNKICSIAQVLRLFHILQEREHIFKVNMFYERYIYVLYTERFLHGYPKIHFCEMSGL